MIRKEELLEAGKSLGVNLMPAGIINEDALIGTIARKRKGHVSADTFTYVYPAGSFPDYFSSMIRIRRGYRQLEAQFPSLFPRTRVPLISKVKQPHFSPAEKLAYDVARYVVRHAANVALSILPDSSAAFWDGPQSTKQPLPSKAVYTG